MLWRLAAIHACLLALCAGQGALAVLLFRRCRLAPVVVFAALSFVLAVWQIPAVFASAAAPPRWLYAGDCVVGLLLFAAGVAVALALPTLVTSAAGGPPHVLKALVALAFLSVAAAAFVAGAQLPVYRAEPADDDEKASAHNADELSLNKCHTTLPPPIVHLELDGNTLNERCVHKKGSDGTLVVPIVLPENDAALNWLLHLAVEPSGLYDANAENWMATRPLRTSATAPDMRTRSLDGHSLHAPHLHALLNSQSFSHIHHNHLTQEFPQFHGRHAKGDTASIALKPALLPAPLLESENSSHSHSLRDAMDGLEEIPMAAPAWRISTDDRMRTVSLEQWEAGKSQWLAHQVAHQGGRLALDDDNHDSHRHSQNSFASGAAPSLHTYREPGDAFSGLRPSLNTFALDNTVHRCITPPQQVFHVPQDPPANAQGASPIKKMIGRLKRHSESETHVMRHAHLSSIATSMISVALGRLSRLGSPRKAMKSFFSRTLFDQQHKKTYLLGGPAPPSFASFLGPLHPKHSADRFWDFDTGDALDKSRVSSVPSAVIGEYDREKWRTLKELNREE